MASVFLKINRKKNKEYVSVLWCYGVSLYMYFLFNYVVYIQNSLRENTSLSYQVILLFHT
jgi:hypothetical protein